VAIPTEFDRYTIVILRRPPDAPQLPEDELDALQVSHVEFNMQNRDAGLSLAAGPFVEQWDESYRGVTIYKTELEETRRIASTDPLVLAGRLRFEAVTWLVPKGTLEP
jgi:uncharacterized protein